MPSLFAPPDGKVLSVSPFDEDHIAIDHIFGQAARVTHRGMPLEVNRAWTIAEALTALKQAEYSVILCEMNMGNDRWKDLLEGAELLMHSAVFIVTSLHADERLWAEALNLGAYDVLAKPFRPAELIHAVNSACMHWQRRRRCVGHPMLAATAAC